MDAQGGQSATAVERARDHIRRQDVGAVRVRVPEEVGERHGREGVVVGVGGFKEFHHYGCWWRGICVCSSDRSKLG